MAELSAAAPRPANLPETMSLDPARVEALRSVGAAFGRTRLRTLVSLRWMAIAGQAVAVLFVHYLLGFELPLAACLAAVGASAWLNVALMAVFPAQHLSSPAETAGQLAFDTVAGVGPHWTYGRAAESLPAYAPGARDGGRLAPVARLCRFAGCDSADLLWRHVDVGAGSAMASGPGAGHSAARSARQLVAVSIGLIFFTVSAWRTGRDEARLVSALDAVQAVLAREQQLSALGALAAATAHELGTPLATIHLAARELGRSVKPGHPAREDVELIIDQAERCRTILKQISQRRHMTDAAMARATLPGLIEEAAEPHLAGGIHIQCSSSPLAGGSGERAPDVMRKPEIIHALGAFIENARRALPLGKSCGSMRGGRGGGAHRTSTDDGPGSAPSVLARAGASRILGAPDRAAGRRDGPWPLHRLHPSGAQRRARDARYNRPASPAKGAAGPHRLAAQGD